MNRRTLIASALGAVVFSLCGAPEAAAGDREIQAFLTERGCRPGGIDGIWGRGSQAALERFNDQTEYWIHRWTSDDSLASIPQGQICGTTRDLMANRPNRSDYVDGPFAVAARSVGDFDVRELGCPTCGATVRLLAAMDFDGDGADEIVVTAESKRTDYLSARTPTRMMVMQGDGEPFPEAIAGEAPARIHEREAVVADFNGDGTDDLFAFAHGLDRKPFPGEQNILLLSQAGEPHVDASFSHLPKRNDFAHGGTAADIDGDGDVDIYVATNEGRDRSAPYFLINDGTGRFEVSRGRNHMDARLAAYGYGSHYFLTARFADMDGDGAPDMLLAGSRWDQARSFLLFGDGTGYFGRDRESPIPRGYFGNRTNTTDIDPVDLDGDGDLDLVVLTSGHEGGNFYGQYAMIFINEGDYFRDETATRLWGQGWPDQQRFDFPLNAYLPDLDGDGDRDLVIQTTDPVFRSGFGDSLAKVGLNDGTGHFTPVTPEWPERISNSGRHLLPGDFDGDGSVELAGYLLIPSPNYGDPAVGADVRIYDQRSPSE